MRTLTTFLLTLALAAAAGCAAGSRREAQTMSSSQSTAAVPQDSAGGGGTARGELDMKTVSLERAEDPAAPQQGPNAAPVERKMIRNATLTLEVEQPAKAMQRIASVAESRGGFVVTSDSRQQTGSQSERAYEVITVELRVPAPQFDAALADIRAAGGSVTAQKITGKDV